MEKDEGETCVSPPRILQPENAGELPIQTGESVPPDWRKSRHRCLLQVAVPVSNVMGSPARGDGGNPDLGPGISPLS